MAFCYLCARKLAVLAALAGGAVVAIASVHLCAGALMIAGAACIRAGGTALSFIRL